MELEANKSKAKKYRKKRKLSQSNANNETVIKPELFDGMTNWLKLQKILAAQDNEKKPSPTNEKKPSSSAESLPHHKKQQGKRNPNRNKWSSTQTSVKPNYKFDFAERKSSVMGSQNNIDRVSGNGDTERNTPRLTKALSMDCEMVGTGPDGADSMLARVSIVNSFGEAVYDTFVAPKDKVTDYRTEISGVRPEDLKNGKDLFEVQKEVLEIIEGRRVVGHDLKHDFEALFISHPKSLIRDTSRYKPFRAISGGRTPSLKKLVAVVLDSSIQSGEHNSIEDAQAAMLLYLKHKHAWEKSLRRKNKHAPVAS